MRRIFTLLCKSGLNQNRIFMPSLFFKNLKTKKMKFCTKLCILLTIAIFKQLAAQEVRTTIDLTNAAWNLTLDPDAKWQDDILIPSPVLNLNQLPVNIPTKGWSSLSGKDSRSVKLPATVEEYYWGINGNKFGVSGNYLGVSWFAIKFTAPHLPKGKRAVLHFESVRFRAEVFVNRKLVGYDLVNSTPFDIDITSAIVPGKENELAVRITDPNGNFDWRDSQNFMWGDYRTQPSHGFGGITGDVKLVITDKVYIGDVFVKNKPKATEADVQITGINNLVTAVDGSYILQIRDNKTQQVVYTKQYPVKLDTGINVQTLTVSLIGAKLWSPEHPNLYTATVRWKGNNGTEDAVHQRFGFRWFEVRDVNGDRQFYLNNKRIVIRTSISWGFWPVNGIAPSNELARKQVRDAKRLGLNMLNFHRSIGQTNVLDAADELGLLYFEEPGGNQYPQNLLENPGTDLERKQTDFYLAVRNEKLFRMIVRDRSHPSLIIYNMHNERGAMPTEVDRRQMLAAHKLDESRILTYNSCNGSINMTGPDPKFKLHLMPYDTKFYDYGWFDQHHAGGPGTYHDNLYNNPESYAKYTDHKDEIMYYGEEGAIGTPPRLQLIRNEILKRGTNIGWETDAYLKWYNAYDSFLKNNGFLKAFPNVDSLTRKMGNVAYYYQGRIIENVRINNTIDGYAINGWESMKLENHSGIVDNYRNFKGDPELISYYNQPLYVAVKLNHKVVAVGDTVTADFFIVNEKDVKGEADLMVTVTNGPGKALFSKTYEVSVTGGVKYGELLVRGVKIPVSKAGYTKVKAEIIQKSGTVCSGSDEIFAVAFNPAGVPSDFSVADSSGLISSFLRSVGIKNFNMYRSGRPVGHSLIVAVAEPQQTGNPLVTELLEWVNNGNTLIITGSNIEQWATFLGKKEVLDFRGMKVMGTTWYGGNFFVKDHPLFAGLPQSCVFNWEYQCLAGYNKVRTGMRINNGETVVACVADHKPEVYSALSIVPHGRGKVILCSLDLLSCIKDIKNEKRNEGDGENAAMSGFDFSLRNPANVVGQQLLINLLKFH